MPPFRPGVNVVTQETAPPAGAGGSTTTWFVAGITEKGPTTPVLVQSQTGYQRWFGERVSYGTLWDALQMYVREQGNVLYVVRVVGPDAVVSELDLPAAGGAISLTVQAKGPGVYGDAIQVTVTNPSGGFVLSVTDGQTTETSPLLADKAAAFTWAAFSRLINLVDGPSALIPAAMVATHLADGDDDRAAITDDEWAAAFARFDSSYGPGQVSAPSMTSDTLHQVIADHCETYGRAGLLDAPDTADVATLLASADAIRASGDSCAMFAPWLVAQSATPGAPLEIPPCALAAGLIARNDPIIGPNAPSAGGAGISLYASGVTQEWTDADRQDLNEGGINVIRSMFQGRQVRVYGWRSLVDPSAANWLSFGNVRLRMALAYEGNEILENYMFDQIDGQNHLFNDLAGSLAGMLLPYYNSGQLYGSTPNEAFRVNVGPQVNTVETIANREIHAVISYKDSPFVEYAELVLVKTPLALSV